LAISRPCTRPESRAGAVSNQRIRRSGYSRTVTMKAVAQPAIEGPRPLAWFRELLEEELAPYPGRAALVARMVIAATLVMLITMTFRLPFGMHGTIFTFVISRESPRATMKAVTTIMTAFGFAAGYVCLGAMFSLDDPMLRFL